MSNELIEKTAEFLGKNKLAESKTDRYHPSEKDKWSTDDLSRYDKGDRIYAHSEALKRPDITSKNISNILARNKDYDIKRKALEHPNASEHDIKRALDNWEKAGVGAMGGGVEHVKKLINHPNAPKIDMEKEYPNLHKSFNYKIPTLDKDAKEINLGNAKVKDTYGT